MAEVAAASSLWSGFAGKAELVGAVVTRTGSQDAASSVFGAAASEMRCTASVAERFPRLASSLAKVSSGRDCQHSAEVASVGEFAVAETGSVALNEPAADRGVCFLSERLWLLVAERDIVASLEDGIQRMRALVGAGARHPLLMTGPSRTADIERVLTIGVHGPRALVIVIVGDT